MLLQLFQEQRPQFFVLGKQPQAFLRLILQGQWLSNLQFCISCNLGFPRNHTGHCNGQSDIESLSPAAQGTAQGTALDLRHAIVSLAAKLFPLLRNSFPSCDILSLAAKLFP